MSDAVPAGQELRGHILYAVLVIAWLNALVLGAGVGASIYWTERAELVLRCWRSYGPLDPECFRPGAEVAALSVVVATLVALGLGILLTTLSAEHRGVAS